MNELFPLLLSCWGALAAAVIGLAAYKKVLESKDDTHIHYDAKEAAIATQQADVAHRLEVVEKWGKLLTVVVAVSGLVLAGWYLYSVWEAGTTAGFSN